MKKILGIVAIALSAMMGLTTLAFATHIAPSVTTTTTTATDNWDYQVHPIVTEVSPDTILPDTVPLCRSGNPHVRNLVCYSPNFIRAAYNVPSNLDGTGQTILIVDAFGSPTIQHDLEVFDNTFGIPAPPSFTILCPVDGCPTFAPNNAFHDEVGWTFETTLDVDYAHAIAPGANIVLVVAATSSGNAINDAEARAISLYPGSIMSQSFGEPEWLVHANSAQFMQGDLNYQAAQAAKITVFASAGDWGATNCFSASIQCVSFANAAFPASDPLVTAVAGTEGLPYNVSGTLSSCGMGQTCTSGLVTYTGPCQVGARPGFPTGCTPVGYGGEQVWNEQQPFPTFGIGTCTGGAPSLFFTAPSYQKGLTITDTTGATSTVTMRVNADVAYNAAGDGGVLSFYSALQAFGVPPRWVVFGGTSAGSPQWAGIAALANQAAGHPLGFLNTAIYKLAGNGFHDITVGNDQEITTPIGFKATTGWDAASGWGTPDVAKLIPLLIAASS